MNALVNAYASSDSDEDAVVVPVVKEDVVEAVAEKEQEVSSRIGFGALPAPKTVSLNVGFGGLPAPKKKKKKKRKKEIVDEEVEVKEDTPMKKVKAEMKEMPLGDEMIVVAAEPERTKDGLLLYPPGLARPVHSSSELLVTHDGIQQVVTIDASSRLPHQQQADARADAFEKQEINVNSRMWSASKGQMVNVSRPSNTQKRKYHINAMALQAAEQEQMLLNARNVSRKQQTRGKYGW